MDFLTHTLIGAGAARIIVPRKDLLPQVSLAAVLASLLPDADPWLYWIDPNLYGRYHRVASHSFAGLTVIGGVAAVVAWSVMSRARWRRFGWFLTSTLPGDCSPSRPRFVVFAGVAFATVYLHWLMDFITGFGNLQPLWPWLTWELSLRAVYSFDPFIFAATLLWHIILRWRLWTRPTELLITVAYVALITAYVLARWKWSSPAFW